MQIPEELTEAGLLSAGSWVLNVSKKVKDNFQTDVIFINIQHIWSLNNYILA